MTELVFKANVELKNETDVVVQATVEFDINNRNSYKVSNIYDIVNDREISLNQLSAMSLDDLLEVAYDKVINYMEDEENDVDQEYVDEDNTSNTNVH